ncbi:hypothetical protein JTB14_028876 [Gonioctena quinquepunctata]|nr:hypothetical protein JTB14_028876 [Gonioctena quinquepunctata]
MDNDMKTVKHRRQPDDPRSINRAIKEKGVRWVGWNRTFSESHTARKGNNPSAVLLYCQSFGYRFTPFGQNLPIND